MQRSAGLSETDPNPWALWLGLVSVSSQKHISKAERGRRMRFQILHGTKITTTLCSRCSAERSDVFDVETCSKSRFPPSSHTTIVALLLQSSSAFSGNPPRCYMKSVGGAGLLWWICLQTRLSVLQYSAILCIQSRHAAFAHMGAKCTNPSDSFVICGLRIMCLLLRNNVFFVLSSSNPFLISVTCGRSIFAPFDWGILIHRAQSVFLSLIYIWSFFSDTEQNLNLYSGSSAQVH